jgi:hypothetical protein
VVGCVLTHHEAPSSSLKMGTGSEQEELEPEK